MLNHDQKENPMTIDDIKQATTEARRFVRGIARKYPYPHIPQDDMEQEAWLGLLRNVERYDPERGGSVENWVGVIASRTIRDLIISRREWKPEEVEVLEDYPDNEMLEEASEGPSERSFVVPRVDPSQEDKIRLTELLEPLSPYQRGLLTMYYVEKLTVREIAAELGVSKSKINRDIQETVGQME